jgi:hypothetical protein
MKRCPKCSRTFPDESQKFCTFDGGLLRADQPAFDPNLTVRATSKELLDPSASTEHDASEAKTSVRLRSLNETITSFGTQTFPETTNLESQTSTSDLPPPPTAPELHPPPRSESAPTSADLSSYAPATVASSHNLAPPAVQSTPVAGSAPPPATTGAPAAEAPKKKSVLPYVLVALVLLVILGGGAATAGYFLVLKPMLEKQRRVITETPNSNTNTNANTSASPSESAPANSVH